MQKLTRLPTPTLKGEKLIIFIPVTPTLKGETSPRPKRVFATYLKLIIKKYHFDLQKYETFS